MMTPWYIKRELPLAYCADLSYEQPSKEWIESVFKSYKTLMLWLKVFRWRPHHDCDDKAAGFRWLCGVKWAQKESRPAQGVAVAEIHYKKDAGGAHAINAVMLDDGSMAFVEPQGPRWIELSYTEIRSIYFTRF